jgi:gliding motility-associated-like protein
LKLLVYFAATFFLLFSSALKAQDIRYVKTLATGTGDGSSWANASGNLQGMINAVSILSNGGQVWVAAGTYKPTTATDRTISFVMKNKVAIYGGFVGTETLLTQRNWNTNVTILSGDLQNDDVISGSGSSLSISGNTENSYNVIKNSGIDNTAILDGFIIIGGNASFGGGMNNQASSPTITNCSFTGNKATRGGGIFNNNSSPTITYCSFSRNTASTGGGMYTQSDSSPTITNCSFTGNTATTGFGGGMSIANNCSPTITNCSFTGNYAANGGGLDTEYNSTPTLTNCSFSGNTAIFGGGMTTYGSSPTLTNCSFTGNTATHGGGMYNDGSSFASFPTLTNCSFTGNTATYGGGMSNAFATSPTLTNCIIWGNNSGIFNNVSGGLPAITYSLVQGIFSGTGNINGNTNPLFVDAANENLRLQDCSPAINAGSNAANSTTVDLGGNTRIVGTIDMGAYEFQGTVGASINWVLDADNDGYYTGAIITGCNSPGTGYVLFTTQLPGDCNDNNSSIYPGSQGRIYVNKEATSGNNNGVSWAHAFISLQDALAATGTCAAHVEIWVAKGTYKPTTTTDRTISFVMKNKVAIYGGFAGTETLVSQRNWTTNVTILSGDLLGDDAGFNNNSENSYNVIKNSGLNNTAILDGFSIKEGNANGTNPQNRGGGMYNSGSSPTITNCSFSGNNASFDGGGIYNNNNSSPNIINCSFDGNNAYMGGGMYNYSSSPTISDCRFSGNTSYFDGGGMYNNSFSSPILTNCKFSGNVSTRWGGGLFNYNSSPLLTNCSFAGNTSTSVGGGVSNVYSSPTFTNCSFAGNTSGDYGGGMWNEFSSPTIVNCSFNGNNATTGAAMYNFQTSSPTITNCIIWGNNSGIFNSGSTPQISYSLVQGISSGTGNINGNTDPLFVDAANGNLRLQACSPAINAGSNAANSTTVDLGGNTRVVGTIDMGAYEFQGTVGATAVSAQSPSICSGQSFTLPWGQTITTSGIYSDTLQYTTGCDSLIRIINLSVLPKVISQINTSICAGSVYTLPWGINVSNPGLYSDTLRYSNGCDSLIRNIQLNVLSKTIQNNNVFVCQGSSYVLPWGQTVSLMGTYSDTLRYISGCDSVIRNYNITVQNKQTQTSNATICQGQNYVLPWGQSVNQQGIYQNTLQYSTGCDSVTRIVNLTIQNTIIQTSNATTCSGLPYTLPWGTIATVSGIYSDTTRYVTGCDSLIRTVNVNVTFPVNTVQTINLCEGQNYTLPWGVVINTSGTYRDTISSAAGCDSLIKTFIISISGTTINSQSSSICSGQSFTLPWGISVTTSGIYTDTLQYTTGCDSLIRIINLSVLPTIISQVNTSICAGSVYTLPWGINVSNPGLYSDTLRYSNDCDSLIRNIQLNVLTTSIQNNNVFVCQGNTYVLPWGQTVSLPGIYSDTLRYISGCDSVVRNYNIIVQNKQTETSNATICQGQNYVLPWGQSVNHPGIYQNTLQYSTGCDSLIRIVNLTVIQSITQSMNAGTCSGVPYTLPWGAIATVSGVYRDTIKYAGGCDSLIRIVNLNVSNNVTTSVFNPRICSGQNYVLASGQVVNSSGAYRDTLRTTIGCDSLIRVVNLTVDPLPVINLTKSNDINCTIGTATLSASGGISYVWSPAGSLSIVNNATTIATPITTTTYTVQVTNANNCSSKDSIRVEVNFGDEGYLVPNAFSPNGDGKNDCFSVKSWGNITNLRFQIFNRWGQVIYSTSDPSACWNGRYKDTALPSDTYVYLISATTACGQVTRKGTVTLIR